MSDELVIRCCAPTLAAIKTGSIFNCAFESRAEMIKNLRELNLKLSEKGVCALPLKYASGKALIYIYRPQMLKRDLSEAAASEILALYDYPTQTNAQLSYISRLIERLGAGNEFPHEIGLFLGYPPSDVRGFINHEKCKCTGLWKVYESDVNEAVKIFEKCKNCTEAYIRRSREGWSLPRLTIRPRQLTYNRNNERMVTA